MKSNLHFTSKIMQAKPFASGWSIGHAHVCVWTESAQGVLPSRSHGLAWMGLLFALFAPHVHASAPEAGIDQRQVRVWAASCAACHGTDGRAIAGSITLAGRNGDELYQALIDFKTGDRPATVMHHHARGYTDAELRALASWFAALSAQPTD